MTQAALLIYLATSFYLAILNPLTPSFAGSDTLSAALNYFSSAVLSSITFVIPALLFVSTHPCADTAIPSATGAPPPQYIGIAALTGRPLCTKD